MNIATEVALKIIEERAKRNISPAFASWVDVYVHVRMKNHNINSEMMNRQLMDGVKEGYLIKYRGINGDMYRKPDAEAAEQKDVETGADTETEELSNIAE